MTEQWLDVMGYGGRYQVSDLGRIRSTPWTVYYRDGRVRTYPGEVMQYTSSKGQYTAVGLRKNGRTFWEYLHRLVAKAFIPNPTGLREVNHKDLDKTNNLVSNLEWVSPAGNNKHAVLSGIIYNPNPLRGEKCGSSKLTNKGVRSIRRFFASGRWSKGKLAVRYGVSTYTIAEVVRRETWKHI